MVKGRRKRAPASGAVHTRATAINGSVGPMVSPMRKEIKLENSTRKGHRTLEIGRSRAAGDKSLVRITSFFSPQGNGTPVNTIKELPSSPSIEEIQHCNGCKVKVEESEEDIKPVEELFKTDETPVAVPCRDPPTPHRINMPNSRVDEPDVKLLIGAIDKKPESRTLSPIQRITAKTGKGPGKLKNNKSGTNESSFGANTNQKVTAYFPVRRSVRKSKKTVLEEKQRDFEQKVIAQIEEGLEVKHFVGKGRGVVTTREFKKGQFVVEYIGDLIDQVTAKKREAIYAQDQNTGCYMYYFQHRGQQYCVDATAESKKLGRLVNHSRNGNLVARVVDVGAVPHLVLTAKEDIPNGVEVSYDYGDRSREAIRNHPWLAL